jgi:hypothetical protein
METMRKELSADFSKQRSSVKTHATAQRKLLDQQYKKDTLLLETITGTQKSDLSKAAKDRSDGFVNYVAEQKREPHNIAKNQGVLVDSELEAAAVAAKNAGNNVAAKYSGEEDSRPDQRKAAREVAAGAVEEIRSKKAPMKSDLLDRAKEFDGGFDDYTADVLGQIEDARAQIAPLLDQLKTQSKTSIDALYKAATDAINTHERTTVASLQKQEQAGLAQLAATEKRVMKSLARTQAETQQTLAKGEAMLTQDIDQQAQEASAQLEPQPGVEEAEYRAFTGSAIAGLQSTASGAPAQFAQVTDAQLQSVTASITQATAGSRKEVDKAKKSASKQVKTTKESITNVVTGYTEKSKTVTDQLPKDQAKLTADAFVEVDKAIKDRKDKIGQTNEKFRDELKAETDENIAAAKTPLTDDLYDRATEAAEDAGKSWWEAVLDAVVSIVTGLLIVIALAMLLVAAGLCSTILGAMLLIGAVMMVYTFLNSLVTRLSMGQGWKGVGFAITDAFGVTGLIEAGTGFDSFTGDPLSDYEKTKRGTESGINLLLIIFGARSSRGGPPKIGGGQKRVNIMTERLGDFNNQRINNWFSKNGGPNTPMSRTYNFLSGSMRAGEKNAFIFFGAIDKGLKFATDPVVNGVKKIGSWFESKPPTKTKSVSQPHEEFTEHTPDDAKQRWEEQQKYQKDKLAGEEADAILNQSKASIDQTTADVTACADQVSGKMEGLEYSLKSRESLVRKISDNVVPEDIVKYGMHEAVRRSAAKINDSMRFTMILEPKSYSKSFFEAKAMLEAKGYKYKRSYNAWVTGDGSYNGLNSTFESPSGMEFELQFHTAESFRIKQETHYLYEEQRAAGTTKARVKELKGEQRKYYKDIVVPEGVDQIK